MALPDARKFTIGTPQISIRDHAGGVAPTTSKDLEIGSPTDVEMDPSTLASGSLYQSAKFDFGEFRDVVFDAEICCEWSVAPTAGGTVDVYLAPSKSATAANANPGGVSGSKSAYVGYGAAAADGIEAIPQLQYIGSLVVTADAVIQIGTLGLFVPPERYASVVIHNNTSQALGPDDNEFQIVFTPQIDQIRD